MHATYMKFGTLLRRKREASGITRDDLERTMGRSPGSLEPVEAGKRLLAVSEIRCIADKLHFDPNEALAIMSTYVPLREGLERMVIPKE